MSRGFELISDLHKDARGFRPTADFYRYFESKTDAEKQIVWDELVEDLDNEIARRKILQAQALEAFTQRINGMVQDYGITRAAALRWDMESFDVDIAGALAQHGSAAQEIEHYLWNQDIEFSDMPPLVKEISEAVGLGVIA